jgi:hypothetical protein
MDNIIKLGIDFNNCKFIFTAKDKFDSEKMFHEKWPKLEIHANSLNETNYLFMEWAINFDYALKNFEFSPVCLCVHKKSKIKSTLDKHENDYIFFKERIDQNHNKAA